MVRQCSLFILLISVTFAGLAEDTIELETTIIKGNKELPKILYIVPWKEARKNELSERKLVLHSLFGDVFEPVMPTQSE